LNDEEVEFLDSVSKSRQEKERAFKEETDNQLDVFRKQRNEVERKARAADSQTIAAQPGSEWEFAGKKRKKAEDKGGLKGVKLRRTVQEPAKETKSPSSKPEEPLKKDEPQSSSLEESKPTEKPVSAGLGLDYGSDSE
jgi:hypothetical protein